MNLSEIYAIAFILAGGGYPEDEAHWRWSLHPELFAAPKKLNMKKTPIDIVLQQPDIQGPGNNSAGRVPIGSGQG